MQVENEQAASKLAASNPQLGLLLGCYEDKRANCLFTITPWAGDTLNDWVHEYGRWSFSKRVDFVRFVGASVLLALKPLAINGLVSAAAGRARTHVRAHSA